eukprot:TRINITY_DN6187_c0_g1::TRINITY_DN6187_c0_g1_i1::g.22668::m.22668 TRINITY_DN6187_c0_g1::TRINITY_DN6187_c0_g1_i1::g.22668  ORF type:complete len:125 (+),score=2.31,sp/O15155/BET1_HUMAN/35.79/1e-14,SNARE/PF05739.14/4.1e-07,DUF1664/PF07889.7/0.059,Use1/PF09753.4/0.095 TRINITY_DN6187_c0_g1_i1:84-458(+)
MNRGTMNKTTARNELFGGYNPRPKFDSYRQDEEAMIEQDNDRHIDSLSEKVAMLKSLTKQIGDDVKEGNKFLDMMHGQFEGARSLLGNTMRKLEDLSKGDGSRHITYLILFISVMFLLVWYMYW